MHIKRILLALISFILFSYLVSITRINITNMKNVLTILYFFVLSALFYGLFFACLNGLNKNDKILVTIISFIIAVLIYVFLKPTVLQTAILLSGAILGGYKSVYKILPIFSLMVYCLLIISSSPHLNYYIQNKVVSPLLNYSRPLLNQYIEINYQSIVNQQKEEFLKGYDLATTIVIRYAMNTSDRNITQLSSTLLDFRHTIEQKLNEEINKNKKKATQEMEKVIYTNIYEFASKYWKLIFLIYLAVIYSIYNLFSSIAHLFSELFNKVLEKLKI